MTTTGPLSTRDKFLKDIREVIADAEAIIKETAGDLSERAVETRQRMTVKLNEAKKHLAEAESVVREAAISGARQTDRVIRDHPYESIGAAFGLGLLIGILINRR